MCVCAFLCVILLCVMKCHLMQTLSTVLHAQLGTDLNLPYLEVRPLYRTGTTSIHSPSVKKIEAQRYLRYNAEGT